MSETRPNKSEGLFAKVGIRTVVNENTITLDLGSDVTVNYIRDPESGAIRAGTPQIGEVTSDSGTVNGLVGRQWQSRADVVAKDYFSSHPLGQQIAAE
jgi:hypothetical protein